MRSDSASSVFSQVTETGLLVKRVDPDTARKCVNQYQFLKELGRGTHGKVKLAIDMTDQSLWAIKIIPRHPRRKLTAFSSSSQNHSNQIKREVAIMKKVNHPAIIRVREVIDAPNSDKIFLVLEYLSGGEILWERHPMSFQECLHTFRKMVQGVNYLHSQGIIHRDIKPANLLKDSHNQIKISDFSVSLVYEESDSFSQVEIAKAAGSPAFLAPEICGFSDSDSDSEDLLIDPFAIDIWAMGVTLYCLAFGVLPFNGDNEFEVYHAINNQPLAFPSKIHIDENLKDLLLKMLDKRTKTRIKMSEIKIHPYLRKGMTQEEQESWMNDSFDMIKITDEDVKHAISIPAIIRKGLKMIKNRFFRAKKRSANNASMDSSVSTRINSLRSHPSVPIMMPYLPEPLETRVSDLRKFKNAGSGLISDNQSEVTDLTPDQPWVTWSGDSVRNELSSDDENYGGLSI